MSKLETVSIFERTLAVTLAREGGYLSEQDAARIADFGGATYRGITRATLRRIKHPKRNPAELTNEEIVAIYFRHYWLPVRPVVRTCPLLAFIMFDMAVQHGPEQAVKLLQRALDSELKVDGVFGTYTKRALKACRTGRLVLRLGRVRRSFLVRWVLANPLRLKLLKGLRKRVDILEDTTLTYALEVYPYVTLDEFLGGRLYSL